MRQELDFAKHELKAAKTPESIEVKNTFYEQILLQFKGQLEKTEAMLNAVPSQKETHRKEVIKFFEILQKYYEDCATAATIK
ncbi:unnamed protein product [Anisakis simplex]|uniref:CRISPR type III A-associated protein Csm2 n=1 Tax=Anisakis simplex TaxID=6269 RepID=A0A0M3J6E6_ANISI|nr:unnamed protein product [Anisakis simplex]